MQLGVTVLVDCRSCVDLMLMTERRLTEHVLGPIARGMGMNFITDRACIFIVYSDLINFNLLVNNTGVY